MHPDCPTVSPYRTPNKLQLRTLQARLALLSHFRRYTRASRKLLLHFTRFFASTVALEYDFVSRVLTWIPPLQITLSLS